MMDKFFNGMLMVGIIIGSVENCKGLKFLDVAIYIDKDEN